MANYKNITYTNTVDLAAGGTGVHQGNLTVGSITFGGTNSGPSFANSIWTTNTSVGSSNWNMHDSNVAPSGKMHLTGDNADIVINGQSLNATLAALQERLNWMQPATEIEAEWDELRELGDRYRELEKQCREKAQMWTKLKTVTKTNQA
jgi:hypothetical protein